MGKILTGIGVFATVAGFFGWLFFGHEPLLGLVCVVGFIGALAAWALTGRDQFVTNPDTLRAETEEEKEPPILPSGWNGPS